jgi:hypothetical protein
MVSSTHQSRGACTFYLKCSTASSIPQKAKTTVIARQMDKKIENMIITFDFSLGLLQHESCALLSGLGHVLNLSCGTQQDRIKKED